MALDNETKEEIEEFMDEILDRKLDEMYAKFQAWALRWFRDTASSALLYFESFMGGNEITVEPESKITDHLFSPTRVKGDIVIDQSGKFQLHSDFSSVKMNISVSLPNCNLNDNYVNLTVLSKVYKGIEQPTEISKTFIVNTSLPLQTFEYTFDLANEDALQIFISTDEEINGGCTIATEFSLLGCITKKESEEVSNGNADK